jgi:hypothetical protein
MMPYLSPTLKEMDEGKKRLPPTVHYEIIPQPD